MVHDENVYRVTDASAGAGQMVRGTMAMGRLTMRVGSTAKVLAECKLECYRISE